MCEVHAHPRAPVQAVKEALAYSRALASLAGDPALPPGLGPVSVYGGRLEGQGRELRELFRCARPLYRP